MRAFHSSFDYFDLVADIALSPVRVVPSIDGVLHQLGDNLAADRPWVGRAASNPSAPSPFPSRRWRRSRCELCKNERYERLPPLEKRRKDE